MPEHPNPKREAFCQQFLVDCNGAAAARRAGYAAKGARAQASQMLDDPLVQERIKELTEARNTKTGITAERVIEEIAKVGFASMRNFISVDADGQPNIDLSHTPLDDLDALSEVQTETVLEGDDNPVMVRKSKIKLHDKLNALHKLGVHTGAFKEPEKVVADALSDLIRGINSKGSASPINEDDAE